MNSDPYTRPQMDAGRAGSEPAGGRFDGLHADAQAAVSYSANAIKAVREQYREAWTEELGRWHELRDEVERLDGTTPDAGVEGGSPDAAVQAAEAAEAGAEDARVRALRIELETVGRDLGRHQAELGRMDVAVRNLESTWLFLERGDASLVGGAPGGDGADAPELRMRIVEAQEAERSRLAQEVHDGPAQSLSNAIFQVEYIERVLGQDPRLAATELRFLRELLRRELGDVRSFISQLRPPVLDELGLDGALRDAIDHMSALTGFPIAADLAEPGATLPPAAQTVALRVAQEALQNIRKHASASTAAVSTTAEGDEWVLEVRDDGRGFDIGAVAARGRRNFGLQFMRERAELIGARFDVRSRPDGGTIVRLAIPMGAEVRT
jgi:two-component system, NarL family, sensor histidine kinase DegS